MHFILVFETCPPNMLPMSPRKRKLLLISSCVGVPVFCLLMVWPLPQPRETSVKSSFLGFMNETLTDLRLTNVTLAIFGLGNFPSGSSPELRDIAHNQNGRWQSRGVPPGMFYSVRIDTNDFTRQIMALPVASTNQPIRFVFEFPGRKRTNVKEMFQRLVDRFLRPVQSPAVTPPARERSLFFTNEITVSGSE